MIPCDVVWMFFDCLGLNSFVEQLVSVFSELYDESYVASDDSKRYLAGHIDGHLPPKNLVFGWWNLNCLETRLACLKLLSTLLSSDVRGAHHVLGGGFKYCFIFTLTWGRFPFWLIFFNGVETTNQCYFETLSTPNRNPPFKYGSIPNHPTKAEFKIGVKVSDTPKTQMLHDLHGIFTYIYPKLSAQNVGNIFRSSHGSVFLGNFVVSAHPGKTGRMKRIPSTWLPRRSQIPMEPWSWG